MIKELYYEWILFLVNFLVYKNDVGFYDNKYVYEKKGWLNWKITKRENWKWFGNKVIKI